MTQEEREDFCNVCKNHRISPNLEVICSLTNRPADFEDNCTYIKIDNKLSRIYAEKNNTEIKVTLAARKYRFYNLLIDSIVIYLLNIFFYIIMIFVNIIFQDLFNFEIRYFENNPFWILFNFIPFYLLYYSVTEALWGKTIGKVITKTKVINVDGSDIGLGKAILRTLCRFIPFDHLSFFDEQRTGWHDRFTKTIVIDD